VLHLHSLISLVVVSNIATFVFFKRFWLPLWLPVGAVVVSRVFLLLKTTIIVSLVRLALRGSMTCEVVTR